MIILSSFTLQLPSEQSTPSCLASGIVQITFVLATWDNGQTFIVTAGGSTDEDWVARNGAPVPCDLAMTMFPLELKGKKQLYVEKR